MGFSISWPRFEFVHFLTYICMTLRDVFSLALDMICKNARKNT